MDELELLAANLSGKVIQNINSTFSGGGVAEILSRIIPLLEQLGVDARWEIMKGNERFFQVTKKFHNALHNRHQEIDSADFDLFREVTSENLQHLDFNGDIIFIHDPQPVALIRKKQQAGNKWIWRCHIDISNPSELVWDFLRPYITQYDAAVFSAPAFSPALPIRQFLISPSIDPLSNKNKELPEDVIDAIMYKYNIPRDKPIITQVSRFDYLKDPVGVIKAFELVKKSIDCRLVFAGGTASDDPESDNVLAEVREMADHNPDIHVLLIPPNSDLDINALQRGSNVIIQKSLGEGFGLTVSEALWKGKPVVASAVGGIPLQIRDKLTGLLSHGIEGTAFAIRQLLSNPDYARWLGNNGREHVKYNFLITRHLKDYLVLFLTLEHNDSVISMLNTMARRP
ncbi:MAG: glycosyltransferase [Dehalococcoidales bacterium]|nr:glycosyltransferase [Dehalococcoidales bacterium]